MTNVILRLVLTPLLLLSFAGGAFGGKVAAMIPQATEAAAAPAVAAPAIDAQQVSGLDGQISQRISSIFAEVPSLNGVTLDVEEGVVSLSGTVKDAAAAQRAEAIASRVQGVVTVENGIERDLTVDGTLGLGPLGEKIAAFTKMLPLFGAAALVALLVSGFGYLISSLTAVWRRIAPNSFLAELIASAIRFVFIIGGLVIALDMIGASALLGAVLGGAGVVGIALGFAMRDTIENYVASLMLSLRQPFRANDHVVIEEHEGRVIRLTSRATILMTLDGNHLRIPNAQVFKAVILNYTRNPQRRFDFLLGIDADDDATAARHLGVEVMRKLPFVLDSPEPQARVEEVGDSNIVIRFLGWIDQTGTDWFKARSQAIPAVKLALEGAGFALPEPIYRLRFDGGTALPLAAGQSPTPKSAAAAPPSPARKDIPHEAEDTQPEGEVERMVDAERATTDENDLLDSKRPVE